MDKSWQRTLYNACRLGEPLRKRFPDEDLSTLVGEKTPERIEAHRDHSALLHPKTAARRQIADLMLSNNVILRYLSDDKDWFDLHPSVCEIPGVAEALARLEKGQ